MKLSGLFGNSEPSNYCVNMANAIIVAAGEGKRMQDKIPKPYIKLKGKPIIWFALKVFNEIQEIENIIIVTQDEWIEYCESEVVEKFGFKKVRVIIKGGVKRQDSVKMGLDAISSTLNPPPDTLLIHDAVRPFITGDFITHLIKMCDKYGAVVPAIPATDTIKEVENGFVCRTLQRNNLYEIQTPQVFKYNIIKTAYENAYSCGFYGTDDASLVERLGTKVKVVPGLQRNIKITTKEDLSYAENLL